MWMWIAGGTALVVGGYEYFKHRPAHAAPKGSGLAGGGTTPIHPAAPSSPIVSAPPPSASSASPGAFSAPPPVSVVITPPGIPQPPGVVVSPVLSTPATDALHDAAAALVTYLNTHAPTQSAFSEASAFQSQFNAHNPSSPLQVDGKYGPKTQAGLQTVISPATAPANYFPSASVVVAGPPVPAPQPQLNVDVTSAGQALVAMGTFPKASIGAVTTFQHAYNGYNPAVHLVEDGKYGPNSQLALQSVLNWAGGGTAPTNPYGSIAGKSVPTFPG